MGYKRNTIFYGELIFIIASSAPFEPNISKIAQKLGLGRNTVIAFLKHLKDAQLLNLLTQAGKGMNLLQKPDKIYFENTVFAYAFQDQPNVGTIRETFFVNQLKNAGFDVALGTKGDFEINGTLLFEVGGKNKDQSQLKGVANGYLALDDIEIGYGNKIPLWLFGFLY
ncbi:MAG: hypothetical protein JJU28_03930 [Cyclobacteriaceae bacterium]|nr:hypothetical protein [Cyclobacteriaceae bacterium]